MILLKRAFILPHNVRILRHSRHTERMYLGMIQLREVIKLDLHTLICSVAIPFKMGLFNSSSWSLEVTDSSKTVKPWIPSLEKYRFIPNTVIFARGVKDLGIL